jgi:hypothetical protein
MRGLVANYWKRSFSQARPCMMEQWLFNVAESSQQVALYLYLAE